MKGPALKTEEKNVKKPILIIDKIGVIGEALSNEFSKDFLVFFASKSPPVKINDNIIFIPFNKKIPRVPDNHYVKIFVVDDGEVVTRESVSSFIRKAKQVSSPLYFLGSIRNFDLEQSDEIIKSYVKAKVLIFGDLFDNKILFDKKASVTKFIIESRKNKKIKVPGEGLSLNYPISFEDCVKLIIKATYIDIPERAVLLFARHPITDISLANTFQKIDPEIDVDFEKAEEERSFYFPKNSQYALAKYDLKKKLSEIDLEKGERESLDLKRNFEFKFVKPILFFLLACVFLLLLPLVTTYSYFALGNYQLNSAKELAEEGEFENALEKSKNAQKLYGFALQTSGPLDFQAKIIGGNEISAVIIKKIDTRSDLSKAATSLLEGAISIKKLSAGNSRSSASEIKNATESFKKANVILQDLKVSDQVPEEFENYTESILPVIEFLSDSSEVLPEALGFNSEKKYLLLFNDNTEIRPGGGVTGSAGLLKIKNGKVTSFEITNSNELDQKLTSLVEAPYFLKRHLPTDRARLRDGALYPDFVTSAINSASIYNLETGKDVDGVIGLNLGFAKKILSATGPVTLSKNNTTVSSENIYEEASKFGNEFQEDDFYLNLMNSLKESFNKNKNTQTFLLLEKIGQGIKEKEIIFAFKDQSLQNTFSANNLSGSLIDQREESSINDFFGISESNLGKNKINHKISRSVERTLITDESRQLTSEIKISFKNNGDGNNESYKNYLQLILPLGSKIQEVSVGGRRVDVIPAITDPSVYERVGFIAPSSLEIEERQEQGKSIFGFLVLIPPQAVRVITINYTLPFQFSGVERNSRYSLIVYKQPGIESYPFTQSFNFPENFSVIPNGLISKEIRNDEKFNFLISEK